ncbi:MAG: hypothetical protein ACFFEF_16065 [Candidatus Thorarchaeota archaeon]
MSLGQVQTTQTQFGQVNTNRSVTAFTPPGLSVQAAKYPILMAGVLASSEPSEWLSIYDHPESWGGLNRDTILSMRKRLIRFTVPIDAKAMEPSETIDTLQKIALSVIPVAIDAKVTSLPPRSLQILGGQLPTGPAVYVKSLEIVSELEISRVAQRITEQDVPASEAVWKLLDYEYSLDQVARIMSVGLLGRLDSRRFVPTRGSYKAVIDAFISRSLMELAEKPTSSTYRLAASELFGENFTILSQPGAPKVDYLRIERTQNGLERGISMDGVKNLVVDSKTALFADHARFSVYQDMIKRKESSHITIFHFARTSSNNILGPWPVRAGVKSALESNQVELDSRDNTLTVLKSLLAPDISVWTEENPLLDNYGGSFRIIENSSPRNNL